MTKHNLSFTEYMIGAKNRFMSYVSIPQNKNDCWEWIGGKLYNGYGRFSVKCKTHLAHRVSYALFVGNIPDNLFVCHTCDNPGCVNPLHLWLGTHQENMDDRSNKNRQAHNTGAKGENNGRWNRKLTEQSVYKIREMIEQGYTNIEIANMFGVNPRTISYIRYNKNWSWLK